MTAKSKEKEILGCELKAEKEELIKRFFYLINVAYSQVGERNEDYLVLQQIHETKSKIISQDKTWSFYDGNDFLINRILKHINAINVSKD